MASKEQFDDIMRQWVEPEMIQWLETKGFFTAPASTKFHGSNEGGLFHHSLEVTNQLLSFTKDCSLRWQKERSPYIVGMFHDLCKIDLYQQSGQIWEYRKDSLLKGHGDKSVMLLSMFYKLTEEEIMCIRYHMGAFTEKEEWEYYTRAVSIFPNILWLHQADMFAAHVSMK